MSLRVEWIDNLKSFGILAVILGHISNPYTPFIFSWHIPLFFFISGFFIDPRKDFNSTTANNIFKLLIPYIVYMVIGVFADILKRILLERPPLNYYDEIAAALYYIDISKIHHYGLVLWFLPTLLVCRTLLYLAIRYSCLYLCILPAIIFSYLIINYNIKLPFAIDKAILSFFWIWNGYIYKNILSNKVKIFFFLLAIPVIYLGLTAHFNTNLDVAYLYFPNLPGNYIFSLSIIFTLAIFFKNFLNIKIPFLNNWGKSTLFLFAIHVYTNNIAHVVAQKFSYSFWGIELILSILLLQILLIVKEKIPKVGIFQYV